MLQSYITKLTNLQKAIRLKKGETELPKTGIKYSRKLRYKNSKCAEHHKT